MNVVFIDPPVIRGTIYLLHDWSLGNHSALAVHELTFPSVPALCILVREYGTFHQKQHRYLASPSQTDPPLCSS